ncbi:MAG TPA: alanine--glyoxylate aminotransferase family protein [Bacteroidota bacterium]|nr:alanine--glyoxylate aminotransferase family protein [Bacteroidota bacterium]
MFKKRLFTPGPTPVPERVMLKMAEPIIHHRNPEFGEIFSRVNKNLQYLFQTAQPVLTLASSGTGGMEAVFVSLFSPGDTIIAVNGGKFGERWVKMPRVYGMNPIEVKTQWGVAPTLDQIKKALDEHPDAKAVVLTHSETSTGTATDVRKIAEYVNAHSSAMVCVDGITSIGAHEFRFDEWGIDSCVTGSQKGLMIPPGLAFVALSKRAIAAMEKSTIPKFYFDLRKAVKSFNENSTPWTPAVSLIIGLDTALEMIRQETIEAVWQRHAELANAVRAGVQGLGLKLFSEYPSYAVTPVWLPEGVEWKQFNSILKKTYGATIAGGQDEYTGKIFRISHLGYYDRIDALSIIAAIEYTLEECNWKFEPGAGVAAVQKSFTRSAPAVK